MTEPLDREDDTATGSAEAEGVETTEQSVTQTPEQNSDDVEPVEATRRINWSRVLSYGVLPGLVLVLAMAAGFLKWEQSSARSSQKAATESLAAAEESTIAILSYQPDSVEKSLVAARDRLAPPYKAAYTKLTNDVVIPGARQDHVTVTATVPAAASVSATPEHAVALLYVNQSAVVGADPPMDTVTSIRVTLKKLGGRWLISGFDPI